MGSSERFDSGRPGAQSSLPGSAGAGDREPSILEAIEVALAEMRNLVRGHATLAVLELQQAGLGLARLIAVTLMVAVLVVTGWLALLTAFIVWASGESISWPALFLIAAALNIVFAIGLAVWAKGTFPQLPFAATLRQLRSDRQALKETGEHATAP